MEEIQMISTLMVTPENAENHSSSRIELTPWDLSFLLIEGIQKGLLFHKPIPHQTPEIYCNNLIDHLKISLSRTLDFFPPLAGRLAATKNDDNTTCFFIDCNNKGAQFTHAVANGLKMSDILEPVYVPLIVYSLFPLNGVPNYDGISRPLLAVQVTELEDGVFISCTMNHCVGDGTCFWDFFNSWSEISRGLSSIAKSPVLTRWFPDDSTFPIPIPNFKVEVLDKSIPPPVPERVFHFTKQNIAKLKAKANSEMGSQSISSLQALLAHFWRSLIRCRLLNGNEAVTMMLLVGARQRFQPPLPEGYFGNAIETAFVKTTARQLSQNGLGWAACEINKIVAKQTNETMKRSYEEWLKDPKILIPSNMVVKNKIGISSSPRHNVYGTDFGWGKPLAVRSGIGNKADGKITVYPGVEQGSIDIEACLTHETLHALGNDEQFLTV